VWNAFLGLATLEAEKARSNFSDISNIGKNVNGRYEVCSWYDSGCKMRSVVFIAQCTLNCYLNKQQWPFVRITCCRRQCLRRDSISGIGLKAQKGMCKRIKIHVSLLSTGNSDHSRCCSYFLKALALGAWIAKMEEYFLLINWKRYAKSNDFMAAPLPLFLAAVTIFD